MKAWFKLLTGKATGNSTEIQAEIEKLTAEQTEVKSKLTQALEALASARLALYGGPGSTADVDSLLGEVTALDAQKTTLAVALNALEGKRQEALALERQEQITEIDETIADLRQWMADLRPDYVKAKMQVKAYEQLFAGPMTMIGTPSKQHLGITGREWAEAQFEFDVITRGRGSIPAEIFALKERRKILQNI